MRDAQDMDPCGVWTCSQGGGSEQPLLEGNLWPMANYAAGRLDLAQDLAAGHEMSFSPVHSRSPGRRGPSPAGAREEPPRSTIFVGNLAPDSDEHSLKEFFTKYGYVTQVKVGLTGCIVSL